VKDLGLPPTSRLDTFHSHKFGLYRYTKSRLRPAFFM